MTTPNNRAHIRPQERAIITKQEPKTFLEAVAMNLKPVEEMIKRHEELAIVIAYLNGTIVGRNEKDVTELLCVKILKENPLVSKHLNITIPADPSQQIRLSEIGKLAAFLIKLIERKTANQ